MMRNVLVPVALLVLATGPALAATSDGRQAASAAPHGETAVRLALNWDQISGNWKQFTGKARQQWGKLTDDDLEVAKGRRDELVGKVQERYGITKEEAGRQVDTWLKSLDP